MKIKYLFLAVILVIAIAYLRGVRFSSNVLLVRHIPFSKIENIHCDFWKCSGGETSISSIGDFFDFNDNWITIKNDTIFVVEEPVGIVLEATKRYFARDYELVIENLTDNKKAYYVAK